MKGKSVSVLGFLALLVACVGCDEWKPSKPLPLAQVDGWCAAMAGVAAFDNGDSQPAPVPKPEGKCDTCGGTGKVGDGRVFVDCMECGGDGVLGSAGPLCCTAGADCSCDDCTCGPSCSCSSQAVQEVEKAPVVMRQVCSGGVCRLVPVEASNQAVSQSCSSGSCSTSVRYRTGPLRRLFGRR